MTPQEIYATCMKYKVGMKVNIITSETELEGKKKVTTKTPAVVIERYNSFLIVEKKSGVQESFAYRDIVILGGLEIRRGRPKASR